MCDFGLQKHVNGNMLCKGHLEVGAKFGCVEAYVLARVVDRIKPHE